MACARAKEFLSQNDVEFQDIDIASLDDAPAVIGALTGGAFGTPTVVIGGEARIGFDPAWMRERLGL